MSYDQETLRKIFEGSLENAFSAIHLVHIVPHEIHCEIPLPSEKTISLNDPDLNEYLKTHIVDDNDNDDGNYESMLKKTDA
jgi:hypothetical protein